MEAALGFAIRASAAYVFLLLLLRLSGKRTLHEGTPFDFVVALVLSDFPDDMIWGEVPFGQGMVAMGTVMLAHLTLVYACCRSARVDRLLGGVPVAVMRAGAALPDGLRRLRMNEDDLDVQLRHHGRSDRREVAEALVEPTGELSLRPTEAARGACRRDLEG